MIHKAAEDFILSRTNELHKNLRGFEKTITRLRDDLLSGKTVLVEQDWGFTFDWAPTEFDAEDCWVRGSLDVLEFLDDEEATGHDWKSGKRYPPKHLQQEHLYVVFVFRKYPNLQRLKFRFNYTDETADDEAQCYTERSYTRNDAIRLQEAYHRRGLRMTSDYTFKPAPSKINCKFCDFKDSCEWAAK